MIDRASTLPGAGHKQGYGTWYMLQLGRYYCCPEVNYNAKG